MFFRSVARLPAKALSQLATLQAPAVDVGDVFVVPEWLAAYWQSGKARPAVVVRAQCSPTGTPAVCYLVYGSSRQVPPRRAVPVRAGEAGLSKDTNFDFGPWLELPALDLARKCEKIGALSPERVEELEAALAASKLPFKGLPR